MSEPAGVGIHQVLVAASPGDAITNLAFGTRRLLRRVGPSEIYARHVAPGARRTTCCRSRTTARVTRATSCIFHASIGQSDVHEFLTARDEPLVLVYHNVTPGEYFEPYDPVFAELLSLGRREVAGLRPRVVCAIADSHYNAARAGSRWATATSASCRRSSTCAGSRQVAPRESTMRHLAAFERPILLSVGQLMPHKRPDEQQVSTHPEVGLGDVHHLHEEVGTLVRHELADAQQDRRLERGEMAHRRRPRFDRERRRRSTIGGDDADVG